jgi:hypothetical protein
MAAIATLMRKGWLGPLNSSLTRLASQPSAKSVPVEKGSVYDLETGSRQIAK